MFVEACQLFGIVCCLLLSTARLFVFSGISQYFLLEIARLNSNVCGADAIVNGFLFLHAFCQ